MCLVAFIIFGASAHIVRIDAARTRNADAIGEHLHKHIVNIRSIFKKSPIFFMCESNMGQEASHIYSMLRRYPGITCANDSKRDGLLTTHNRKELYILELQRYIMTNSIFFCKDVNRESMAILKRELIQFKRIVVENPRARAKFYYTGKDKGQDDTVMALSMGLWWAMQKIRLY